MIWHFVHGEESNALVCTIGGINTCIAHAPENHYNQMAEIHRQACTIGGMLFENVHQ